jgi:hypothetical protein
MASGERTIEGTYRFESIDACVQRAGDDLARDALLPVDRMAPGSTVGVEIAGGTLRFRYSDLEGNPATVEVSLDDAVWEGSRLVFRPASAANAYPGVAGGSRSCSIYTTADGKLVVRDREVQTGLTLFLVPFRDREETVVILEPLGAR